MVVQNHSFAFSPPPTPTGCDDTDKTNSEETLQSNGIVLLQKNSVNVDPLKTNTVLDYKKRGKDSHILRFCSCQVKLEGDLPGSKTKEVERIQFMA